MQPDDALGAIWRAAGLPPAALPFARLTGGEPVLPSSFAVGTAAQTGLAAAALAAAELRHQRGGPRQQVAVEMADAALECCGHFTVAPIIGVTGTRKAPRCSNTSSRIPATRS